MLISCPVSMRFQETPVQATYFGAYEAGKVLTQPLRAGGHGVAADMATGLLQQTAAGVLFTP